MVTFPGANAVDVIGPLEVFASATALATRGSSQPPVYTTEVVAPVAGPVETQSGIAIVARRALGAVRGGVDTLLVAGGLGTRSALDDRTLIGGIRRLAPRVRRLGSVCSGSFLLAEAGLLDGRRATTAMPDWVSTGPATGATTSVVYAGGRDDPRTANAEAVPNTSRGPMTSTALAPGKATIAMWRDGGVRRMGGASQPWRLAARTSSPLILPLRPYGLSPVRVG